MFLNVQSKDQNWLVIKIGSEQIERVNYTKYLGVNY